ncbi:MAG TPA: transporter substrate-binding domain-containing protein [Candidatus Cybelea sp.]|nr:transporter substrate-binding domain-containing protein [Candidatus Cybelea sp.]
MTIAQITAMAFIGASLQAVALAETVRVVHPIAMPPLIYVKDGKTVGRVADVLRVAASREGITIAFVPMSSGFAAALKNGTADAVAPMLISSKNELLYDFTDAIVTTGGGLFVRAPNGAPSDLTELAGKTVATPSFGPFVTLIREHYPSMTLDVTSSYAESITDVLSKKADAAALNIDDGAAFVAAAYAGQITVPTVMFVKESLGLAVAKGSHGDLVRRINAGLAAIRADGTLQRIEQAW